MTTTKQTRAGRITGRIGSVLAELDYAQRRLLEIRTGVPMFGPGRRQRVASTVDELEALYADNDPRLSSR